VHGSLPADRLSIRGTEAIDTRSACAPAAG
jgi:hypothetical protein